MDPIGLVIAGCGAFAMFGAGFDREWFAHHRRGRLLRALLGPDRAQVCYSLVGSALILIGALVTLGVIPEAA